MRGEATRGHLLGGANSSSERMSKAGSEQLTSAAFCEVAQYTKNCSLGFRVVIDSGTYEFP